MSDALASNQVVGLTVAGLATLREALGSAGSSARFRVVWAELVERMATEIGFAFLDGVEVGAGSQENGGRGAAALRYGDRLRKIAAAAYLEFAGDDLATLRGASSYWKAIREFSAAHGLDATALPTFDPRLHGFEQFEPSADPQHIRSELEAALETLTAPIERKNHEQRHR